MSAPTLDLVEVLRWVRSGTELLVEGAAGLDEPAYDQATLLPGWSRRHLVAHVASNAVALGRLVHWARTGEPTPMYASPEDREAGIERGTSMSAHTLTTWLQSSAEALAGAIDQLTDEQWDHEVVTGQGRTVSARQIPWLRAREVCVHAVDVGTGVTFGDLPDRFLTALRDDIGLRRGLRPADQPGPLPEIVAWLSGRPHRLPGAPVLSPWL